MPPKAAPPAVGLAVGPTRFRSILEGSGGTYNLAARATIQAIGTTGCNTCLGLYVPIATNRVFIAHLNFEPQDNRGIHRDHKLEDYQINGACYRAIVMTTKEWLADAQWRGRWISITPNMANGLRMISPRSNIPGITYVADAAAQGVREFFGITGTTGPNVRPRQLPNMIVTRNGGAHTVHYPTNAQLRTQWTHRREPVNGDFATADIRDNGQVRTTVNWEGPF